MTTICADCHQLLPNERSIGSTVEEYLGKLFPPRRRDSSKNNLSSNTASVTAATDKQSDIISEIIELFEVAKNNNWDSEGALAIPHNALRDAINFVVMLPQGIALPEVGPSSNGAIDFEWDFDDSRCNVELFGDGKLIYAGYFTDEDREYGTKRFNTAIPKILINLLERMEAY
ncbi:MAG TPA: hypothetical protein ENH52_14915 [Nitrospirae bacterium]|nr:hypothetical protein [Nitrospirota bacterium]